MGEKGKFLDKEYTRRQFLKLSGKSLAGLALSSSLLSVLGVTADAVRHQFERTVRHLRALMQDWTFSDFYPPSRGAVKGYTRRTMKNREEKRMRETEVLEGKTNPADN